jgi:hypothetical protein
MQQIQFLLEKDFIFYWVDGVFFDYNTPPATIKLIEDYLIECGYDYKYEDVDDFNVVMDDKKIIINMVKNGKPKQYMVGKDTEGESVRNYLEEQIKEQKNQPNINQ